MPPPPSTDALPRVQNFKVHKLLGKGSYGKVYKVQRETDGQFYALKETELGAMSQAERMDAVNEVRLLVSISHPSVIRYHEAFLNGNKLCVVMEYAPFGDLKYYVSKGLRLNAPFPEEAIWRIFLQLCQGLSALHANNIIHRDIKPANIFLCQNDVLKIGDLGVAKALNRIDFAKTQIGTPVYMAPEVWTGKLYSYSSDLWSLGCVLYEMMTFRVPVEGRSLADLKAKVARGQYSPVPQGRYSPELISLCHSLLNVEPRRRPSPEAILKSTAASKWLRVLPAHAHPLARSMSEGMQSQHSGCSALADTIIVPRDIRNLPRLLPPPSYEHRPLPGAPPPSSSSSASSGAAKPIVRSSSAAPPSPRDAVPSRDQLQQQQPREREQRPRSASRFERISAGGNEQPAAGRPPSAGRARPANPQPTAGLPSAVHGGVRPRSAYGGAGVAPVARAPHVAGGVHNVYGGVYGGAQMYGGRPVPGLSGLALAGKGAELLPGAARPQRRISIQ
ncbi:hypothetical protein FOA52_000626 [Chlamydomonas sp. UWO 241]|nr:hypothetical protein FOA52_000626 [Chlamydomonas sp. UWO 241]